MLVENFTVSLAGTPGASRPQLLALLQLPFWRLMKRYSILAVRLSVKAASMPAPAVQPALVLLWKLPFMPDEISPNAPPVVP